MQCILMNEIYKIGIGTTTTANRDDAETIANTLLNENLVSCVQIIEGIESKFIWDGKIQEVTECKLTVKFNLKDTEKIEKQNYRTARIQHTAMDILVCRHLQRFS